MTDYYEESLDEIVKNKDQKEDNIIFESVKIFESNIIELKDKRIKFLKIFSSFLLIALVAQAIALAMLSPLKTSVPYLIRVDQTTGFIDKVDPFNDNNISKDEVLERYFLARYVENRESYDFNLLNIMYEQVESYSNNSVLNQYQNFMKSEVSPIKKLKSNLILSVKVNSITFLDDDVAQVRLTKRVLKSDGTEAPGYSNTKWLATIAFDFNKSIPTEADRLLNPLGFQIISYKLDQELVK